MLMQFFLLALWGRGGGGGKKGVGGGGGGGGANKVYCGRCGNEEFAALCRKQGLGRKIASQFLR